MNRGYESYFRRSQQVDYVEHYVNYGLLKAKLNDYYTRRRDLLRALSNEKGRLAMDDFVKLCGSDNDAHAFFPSTANANNTTGVNNRGGVVGINTANSFVTDDALLDQGGNGCEYFLHNDDDDDNYDNNDYDEYDNGMYYGCSASPSSNYHQTNTTTTINHRRRGKFINGPTAIRHLSKLERLEFDTLLKIELQRSASYYMHTLLPTVRHHIVKKEYTTASRLLLETVAFAITNIITYRQLIIRYDAFCWTFDIVTPVLGRPLLVQHHKWEDGLNTTTTTTTTLAANANGIPSSLPVGRVQRIWDEELNTTTATTTTSNSVSSSLPVGGISSHITTTTSSNNENEQYSVSRMFALWGINELEISIIVGVQESRTHYMLGEEIPNTGMMEQKPIIPTINDDNNNNNTTSTTTTLSNTPPTTTTTTTRGEGDGTIMTTDDIDALTTQISSFRCLLEKTERATILQRSRSSNSSSHTTTTTATDVYILRDRLLLFGARIIDYLLIDLQRREYCYIYIKHHFFSSFCHSSHAHINTNNQVGLFP